MKRIFKLFMILEMMLQLFNSAFSQCEETNYSLKNTKNSSIEDFLITKLEKHRILIIPECLSHDSYDAIRLPLRIISRWKETNNPNKLIIGLEHDNVEDNIKLVKNNQYNEAKRFATICPNNWGLFSTRRLNEYLYYLDIMNKSEGKFKVFGFENSYHYYNKVTNKYLLPSQIDDSNTNLEKVPFLESDAPMIIKYTYSKFFRDYLSFGSIEDEIKKNPDAFFIIIVGNAHTAKSRSFNNTDYQIIDAYEVDTTKYAHNLGYYLNQKYNPLFIQTKIDTLSKETSLCEKDNPRIDSQLYSKVYIDYLYLIPDSEDVNLEEPPLLSIPASSNLTLLQNKNFQYYPNDEFEQVAKKLIYLFTGITPEIVEDYPGQIASCTFINPKTKKDIDLTTYKDSVIKWYDDGTFIRRISENLSDYNHRSLFKGIFRMIHKDDFKEFTNAEQTDFTMYLLAALSVIGNEKEREFSRKRLEIKYGPSNDNYYYFKKFYSKRYRR